MCKRLRQTKLRGMTLVELLVVVLILAILLAVAIPLYLRSVRNSAQTACHDNIMSVANLAKSYRTSAPNKKFPTSDADLNNWMTQEGSPTLATLKGPYGESYEYVESTDGNSFSVECEHSPSHGTYSTGTGTINAPTTPP
ncbi:MAG: prepilin-type N-terminal cleavage/methylation domain-containing protein [Abditibacteriales bacterium]|nr:prepilin-type N-terminal cleavage/methylation domain-containing protein [Abditibacteriales bacterium]MDW8364972.1 prepilin-type N-terminal cleavage/methylation domain-containing protein [Abditibacteriales bacterium]